MNNSPRRPNIGRYFLIGLTCHRGYRSRVPKGIKALVWAGLSRMARVVTTKELQQVKS